MRKSDQMNLTQTPFPPYAAGVDLSLTSTGVCTIGAAWDIHIHRIESKPLPHATVIQKFERMNTIADRIMDVIAPGIPVALEGPAYGAKGSATHDIAGNWWNFIRRCWENGNPVTIIAPTSLKQYATGAGNASKDQVLAAVVRRYDSIDVNQNDIADAVVLAAMLRRHLGHPIDDMPQLHLKSLDKVTWAV